MNVRFKKLLYSPLFIIACFVFIAFFPIATMSHVLGWDLIEICLPWRYFISESLSQGDLPVWNPYQNFGFPQYFDNQTFYPVIYLFSLFGSYGFYTIQLEWLLHLYIGGVGFYFLARYYTRDKWLCTIAAICYLGSGFFYSHAQHLGWIISAAWFPWVSLLLINFLNDLSYKNGIAFIVGYYLFYTGGYPAFAFVSLYIFIFYFLYKFLQNRRYYLDHISILISISLLLLILMLGVLYAQYESSLYITRSHLTDVKKSIDGDVSLAGFLTVFLPEIILLPAQYLKTHFVLTSIYFGWLPLISISYFVIKTKMNFKEWVLCIASILMLILAMAKVFPLRSLFYDYIPLMDLFRFAGLFRYFFISGMLLLFVNIYTKIQVREKWLNTVLVVSFFVYIILSILFFMYLLLGKKMLMELIITDEKYYPILMITVLHIAFLFFFFLFKNKIKSKLGFRYMLLLFLFCDMSFQVNTLIYKTAILSESVAYMQQKLNESASYDHIPRLDAVANHNAYHEKYKPLWQNQATFEKEIASSGYNPYVLKTTEMLEHDSFYIAITNNPFLYLAKTNAQNILSDDTLSKRINNGIVIAEDILALSQSDLDTFYIKSYAPRDLIVQAHIASPRTTLVLQQNTMPFWKVELDDVDTPILEVNRTQMAVPISEGNHKVHFYFEHDKMEFLIVFSLFFFVVLLFFTVGLNFGTKFLSYLYNKKIFL